MAKKPNGAATAPRKTQPDPAQNDPAAQQQANQQPDKPKTKSGGKPKLGETLALRLKADKVIAGENCERGKLLAEVKLADVEGVTLNYLVDAVRDGFVTEIDLD